MNVDTIAAMQQHPGPFLSTYFDVTRATADAPHRIDLAWGSAREQLLEAGAPESLVDLVESRVLVPTSAPGEVKRMIVAAGEEILLVDDVRDPSDHNVVSWGPLPDVTDWLTDRDKSVSVLLVLADREGADLELYRAWPGRPAGEETVGGEDMHLNKVFGGGLAHKQYQRHTEQTWRRNAEEVASELEDYASRGMRLIAIAGDAKAVGSITDELSEPVAAKVTTIDESGRAEGSSRDALDGAVDDAVHEVVMREHLELVRELDEGTGIRATSAHGIPDVLNALVQGKVRTLLVAPSVAANHLVAPADYLGLSLPAVAAESDELRADLVSVWAAAATDADVAVLGTASLPDDGMAAVLRWEQ